MKKLIKKFAILLSVILFWLAVWFIASLAIDKPILFPSPIEVIKRLCELIPTLDFWKITFSSLIRIFEGIVIAILLGIAVSLAASASKIFYTLINPLMIAIKSTPVASFIVLLIIWLDRDVVSVVISIMIALPLIFTNLMTGLGKVDTGYLRLAKVYRFSLFKKLRRIYIPSVMPFFISACRMCIGLAWKAGIAAEVLSRPTFAIGSMLYDAKMYLEMVDLMAWTLVVIILSIIIEYLFVKFFDVFARKYNSISSAQPTL